MRGKKHSVMHIASGDVWAGSEVAVTGLLRSLKSYHNVGAIVFNEGELAHRLYRNGVKVYIVQEKGSFRDMTMLARIARILRTNKVELLHTHGYKENVFGVAAGRFAGVKRFVCTHHGGPEPFEGIARIRRDLDVFLDRIVGKYSIQRTICVSEDLRRTLTEKYRNKRMLTIHNGIELLQKPTIDKVTKKTELGLLPQTRVVGTVGRLVPVKGIHHFLEAAKLILETRTDVRFLIVGDGPLEQELKDVARRLAIHDRVLFMGFRADAVEIMSAMDVFILTSLHEGIPLSLLEAMWLGLPVVATRVGGMPEVIVDGRSGMLVKPGDEEAIAGAILDMLSPAGEGIGREARQRVFEEFSLRQMVERTEEVYRELLD